MPADLVPEILALLQEMTGKGPSITPETRILVDLDLDSLQMLDLIESINAKYGVDLFMPPYTMDVLRTPATLAETLARAQLSSDGVSADGSQSPGP